MNKIVLYESKPSLLRKKDFIKYLNQIFLFYQINKNRPFQKKNRKIGYLLYINDQS